VSDVEGLLLLDKSQGPTSHDVVDRIRELTGQKRVGHAGTLDPMATGLLPVLLGRGTRLMRFLPHAPKVYSGTIELGITTTTDDTTGEILSRYTGPAPPRDSVAAAARSVREAELQTPPTVSARKIGGERSYRLARRGVAVEPAASRVSVSRFELSGSEDPWVWSFVVEVSAGTYVRALARDLGRFLGCGGAVRSLRRLRIGPLDVSVAIAVPESRSADFLESLIPLEEIPLFLPAVHLRTEAEATRFTNGVAVDAPDVEFPGNGICRVLDPKGRLLGIGDVVSGHLRPSVVLPVGSP
jgi:tRNA pseudouridine55 synthase